MNYKIIQIKKHSFISNTLVIGSGKIKRRVFISLKNKDSLKFTDIKLKKHKQPEFKYEIENKYTGLNFINSNNKIVFHYWNSLGFPCIKHRENNTSANRDAINKIQKTINKYGKIKVMETMDLCKEIFTSYRFEFNLKGIGIKLTLGDFFKYSRYQIERIRTYNKKLYDKNIKSWFEECLHGKEYMENKYLTFQEKDPSPNITSALSRSWKKYINQDELDVEDKEAMIRCCKYVIMFAKNNPHITEFDIVEAIDIYLNRQERKPKLIHAGYLTNNIFWKQIFPKFLVHFGIFKRIENINI